MCKPLPLEDLQHVLTHVPFDALRDARVFITGGTGFFGHWLLESLLHANRELALNVRVTVLTRNAAAFQGKAPHIAADRAITLLEGDIQTFAFPREPHTYLLHAATDSTGAQASVSEAELAASILAGTERIVRFAAHTHCTCLLYVSSGAVYGRNIRDAVRIAEARPLPPTPTPPTTYDEAKRASESLCLAGVPGAVVARCFAFAGPHLPLDRHFAIGNFIRDALAGTSIHIKGDGTPLRSFLYMSDLAIWLWTMLATAPAQSIYNVGSDEAVSITQLARLVASHVSSGREDAPFAAAELTPAAQRAGTQPVPIRIDGTAAPGTPPATYVPDITHARTDLGLRVTVPLAEAIRRTARWHKASGHDG